MTYRAATQADIPAISAFLRARVQTSMFPLANLLEHGLGGAAPRAMRFWLREDGQGVFGQTNEGVAMPQIPDATEADWRELARLGSGAGLAGAMGETAQVFAMLDAWNIPLKHAQHASDEQGYGLDLATLHIPQTPRGTRLVPVSSAPRSLVEDWRAAYHTEVLGAPPPEAQAAATADVTRWIVQESHMVLTERDTPVALTGFNAVAGDVVQIGGVYTPPGLRGKGFARRALALHLADARTKGMRRAVLFAANAAAARAYTAIGFRSDGRFAMVLFRTL